MFRPRAKPQSVWPRAAWHIAKLGSLAESRGFSVDWASAMPQRSVGGLGQVQGRIVCDSYKSRRTIRILGVGLTIGSPGRCPALSLRPLARTLHIYNRHPRVTRMRYRAGGVVPGGVVPACGAAARALSSSVRVASTQARMESPGSHRTATVESPLRRKNDAPRPPPPRGPTPKSRNTPSRSRSFRWSEESRSSEWDIP